MDSDRDMLNIGLAMLCAAIGWWLAITRTAAAGEPDPFGFSPFELSAVLIGGGYIACMAVARYLTYRPGRGLRMGLANFMLSSAVLVAFFVAVFFVHLGGDLTDLSALKDYALKVLAVYGAAAFVAFAAFLSCELLLARL